MKSWDQDKCHITLWKWFDGGHARKEAMTPNTRSKLMESNRLIHWYVRYEGDRKKPKMKSWDQDKCDTKRKNIYRSFIKWAIRGRRQRRPAPGASWWSPTGWGRPSSRLPPALPQKWPRRRAAVCAAPPQVPPLPSPRLRHVSTRVTLRPGQGSNLEACSVTEPI
jgi:hypothetical protein